MCSREEVHLEVLQSEQRMNDRIDRSHMAMAKTISDFGAEIKELGTSVKELSARFEKHDKMEQDDRVALHNHIKESNEIMEKLTTLNPDDLQALKEIAEGYTGFSTIKKMLVGLAGLIIAIGTIIMGVIHIIRSVK